MFQDTSDTPKSKRALLTVSSIGLIVGIGNMNLETINLAVIEITEVNGHPVNKNKMFQMQFQFDR